MRRSTLAVLTTVSLAALVSVATSAGAVQSPSVILGVLKPVDNWKVGTVNVTGASFCAMVNKYDSGVGLAFARSPEGYGTVAMDLRQNVFTPDNTYDVELKADGTNSRKLQGRATSARSLVVQIGQDKALYEALKGNGTMEISLPAADVSFSLLKFSNSFKSLVSCSDKLAGKQADAVTGGPKMAAVKVQDVEQDSLAPIDKEVQTLNNGAKAPAQTAATDGQNSLDAQLDAAANSQVQTSKTNIAKLDEQHEDVTAQINAGREQVAQLQDQQQKVERKLLASIHSETPPVPPSNTGAEAKLWDEQQAQAAAQRSADEQAQQQAQQAVAAKDAQIATLEDSKEQSAQKQVADAAAAQATLDKKAAVVEKQRDALAAKETADSGNKALKAALVAKEAQLADITAKDSTERGQLTQKLAATQSDFQTKISSLETERDGLKTQLAAASAEAAKWQQADVTDRAQAKDLETKLAQSNDARHGLETRIAQLDAQTKTLASANTAANSKDLAKAQADLADIKSKDAAKMSSLEDHIAQLETQQKSTASANTSAAGKELAAAQAELAGLKEQDTAKVAALEEKLTDKDAQFDALKGQFDTLQHQPAKAAALDPALSKQHQDLTDQLSKKQAEIDQLQQKLAQIESDRATEASHAQQAQADLVSARQQVTGMRKSLVVIDDSVIPAKADAKPEQFADASKAQAEMTELRQKNAELSAQLALEATKPETLPGGDPKAQSELADLKAKNEQLTEKLADSAAQTAPDLKKAQADLADLKSKNADLSTKLAAATQAAQQSSPELVKAQADLADLRAKNAELSSRVASAAMPAPGAMSAELDKAQADLADLRAKNAELSSRLASAAPASKGVDDSKTQTELALLKSKNAELSAELSAAQSQPPVMQARAQLDAQIAAAQTQQQQKIEAEKAEIAALHATKVELEQGLASGRGEAVPVPPVTQATLPPATTAHQMAQMQPSAGDAVASAQTAPAGAADSSYDENRAAAFLDRIMAYHRPAGAKKAPAAPVIADEAPVFGSAPAALPEAAAQFPAAPVPHRKPLIVYATATPSSSTAAASSPAAAAPAVRKTPAIVSAPVVAAAIATPVAVAQHSDPSMSAMPSDDEIAATPLAPPAHSAPVVSASSSLPVQAAEAPVTKLLGESKGSVSLENLLSSSGVDAQFKTADGGNVRQWSAGKVNGMYEQMPAGDFKTLAAGYINRYRQDCPGKLDVNMGQPQTTSAGTFAEANISCSMTSNRYSTSFVFLQGAGKFSAILHSGYPEDASKIHSIGDSIAYSLGNSGGLAGPSDRKADASSSISPATVQHHFNIPSVTQPSAAVDAGAGAHSGDSGQTVVVQ